MGAWSKIIPLLSFCFHEETIAVVVNASFLNATLANLNVSKLMMRPFKNITDCMPLSNNSKAPWPDHIMSQLERTSAIVPPLVKTHCPRNRIDCLQATTVCIITKKEQFKVTRKVISKLTSEIPDVLVQRIIVMILTRSGDIGRSQAEIIGKTNSSVYSTCNCSDREHSTFQSNEAKFVIHCEQVKNKGALARSAQFVHGLSMLLMDTTAVSERENTTEILNLQKLFDIGLRTHLNSPYSTYTCTLNFSRKYQIPTVFASTLSVLDFGFNHDSTRTQGIRLHYNILHQEFARHVSQFDIAEDSTETSKHKTQIYHVVWSTDSRDIPGVLASLTSALEVSADPAQLAIHIIAVGNCKNVLRASLDCIFQSIPRRPRYFQVYSYQDEVSHERNNSISSEDEYLVSGANFDRFELDHILPEDIDQVAWIDADTIVRADLALLIEEFRDQQQASRKPLAVGFALRDTRSFLSQCCGRKSVWPEALTAKVGGRTGSCGFNAGIMVIDLRLWRSTGLASTVQAWIDLDQQIGPLWRGATQPPLIFATRGENFATLHHYWNKKINRADESKFLKSPSLGFCRTHLKSRSKIPQERLRRLVNHNHYHVIPHRSSSTARILHFAGEAKPWSGDNNSHAHLWLRHGVRAIICLRKVSALLNLNVKELQVR